MDSPTLNDKELIEAVKGCTVLYDKTHPEFRNAHKKKLHWAKVAHMVGSDASTCETRFVVLRNRYGLERRKQEDPLGSGAWSTWHLYENMSFLNQHVVHRRLRSSRFTRRSPTAEETLKIETFSPSSSYSFDPVDDEIQQSPVTWPQENPTPNIKRIPETSTSNESDKPEMLHEMKEAWNKISSLLNDRNATVNDARSNDPDYLFSMCLYEELKKVPENKKFALKAKLMEVFANYLEYN